jgi:hypothetical protein
MTQPPRAIPTRLSETWRTATEAPSALAALAASRTFWEQWAQWQATLVAESIRAGATWDDVGRALGTSRQAAWARFRNLSGTPQGDEPMPEQLTQVRRQLHDGIRGLQQRMRQRDDAWRTDRQRLRDELRQLDRQRAEDRKALQGEIRQLRQQLRDARYPAPDPSAQPTT